MKKQHPASNFLHALRSSLWAFSVVVLSLAPGLSADGFTGQQAAPANEPPAIVPSVLIPEVDKNGAVLHKRIQDYTYSLKKTLRILNDQAKVKHEDVREYEAYPVRGEHVLIQVSQNGKPLRYVQIAEQRRRAGESLKKAEIEKEEPVNNGGGAASATEYDSYMSAAVYGKFNGKTTYISMAPTTFLRSCQFSSPRLEHQGGRDLIVLNFEARPGVSLPVYQSYIVNLRGTVWIDALDKILVRLVGWSTAKFPDLTQSIAEEQVSVLYEQTKLPTGVWAPTLIRVNTTSDPLVFNGVTIDVRFQFSDYKSFQTESEDFKPIDKDQKSDKKQKPETDHSSP